MSDLVQGWGPWWQTQGHVNLRADTSRGSASVRTTVAMSAKRKASTAAIAGASAAGASAQSTAFESTWIEWSQISGLLLKSRHSWELFGRAFKTNKTCPLLSVIVFFFKLSLLVMSALLPICFANGLNLCNVDSIIGVWFLWDFFFLFFFFSLKDSYSTKG